MIAAWLLCLIGAACAHHLMEEAMLDSYAPVAPIMRRWMTRADEAAIQGWRHEKVRCADRYTAMRNAMIEAAERYRGGDL